MKTKILYILSVLALLTVSCSDIIEEEQLTFLAPEALKSEDGATALLKGAYSAMQEGRGYYKQHIISHSELRSDYMLGSGSRFPLVSNYIPTVWGSNQLAGLWESIYSGINIANTLIAGVPNLDADEDFKSQIIAEAKVLRALHYFNLVKSWGEVPLRTVPVNSFDDMPIGKSSVEKIYQQVIKDLDEAISSNSLVEEHKGTERGRASLYAAKVILADVYLTIGEYQNAADVADEIIKSGKFALEPSLAIVFSPEPNATHSGEIWSIIWIRQGSEGNRLLSFMHAPGMGYSKGEWRRFVGNLECPLIRDWDDADNRKLFNLYDVNDPEEAAGLDRAGVPMLFKKFIDKDGFGQDAHGNDQPIYRYAGVLTIFAAAECLANDGPTADAYEALNQVRRRGYGVDISAPNIDVDYAGLSKDEFMDAVWNERALEFMIEGKRWYDLKRMPEDKAIALINAAGKGEHFSSDDWLYPIPLTEIDNNDALTGADQNPGY